MSSKHTTMAHTEELKKWDALEHICVCFLPGETVRQLDILLNPAAPLRNDWRMVADRLGYNFNETQHLASLRKDHGSQFLNMLEDYKTQKSHSVKNFLCALNATEREDVRSTIKNTYEEVTIRYHQRKHTEAVQKKCCADQLHILHSPNYPERAGCINCNLHLYQECQLAETPWTMDHNIGTAASPELPPDHSYPNPNVSHMVNMQNAASYHHLLMQKQQQQPLDCTTKLRESINVKPLIKSEHGLEHPPYTPVPGTVREITKLRKQDPLESTDGYTTEKQIIESIKNGGHGRIDMKIDPGIGEYEVMDTESFLEKQHKSTDSSESTDSKRNSYPKYEKNDSTPSELIGQLRPFHSTQSRLETAPFNKGIREVFVTYPDDKPVMKYVFQLLDNLQRNNFRTSADEKHKDEKTPEKIIRRFHRSDFVIVCISSKYKEQVSASSPENYLNQAERLHTADIYQMMQKEVEENGHNDRFIPILLKGATFNDVPPWLREICPYEIFYQWPSQYKSLLFHLIKPQKLVERYQKSMRDMSKRSLQSTDKKNQPLKKQSKYHSSGY